MYSGCGPSRLDDRSGLVKNQGGKSELYQAGYWVTPRRGNPTESATETYRPSVNPSVEG